MQYIFLPGKWWHTIFTHEFVFTKRISEGFRASESVCLLYTNWDLLEIQGNLLNRFYKYPCSFEGFLGNLQKGALEVKSRLEIEK